MTWQADGNGLPEDRIVRFSALRPFDFLLVKSGDEYRALCVDGTNELVDPIDGTPRPDPDNAVKTKNFKVPTELRDDEAVRTKAPSRFTGQMRRVVSAYHAAGRDSVFSSTYTCTHGLVRKLVPDGDTPRNKFWLVEINKKGEDDAGVFIAPVNFTMSSGISTADISKLLPSAAEKLADPTIETRYGKRVSLAWAFGKRPTVTKLVDDADLPTGSVYNDNYGWAFSESGAQAQNITWSKAVDTSLGPVVVGAIVLKMNRWLLEFALAGDTFASATLTAAISHPEVDREVFYPENGMRRLWYPVTAGAYRFESKFDASAATGDPWDVFADQDAPVHVHYDGEDPIIVRWRRRDNSGSPVLEKADTIDYVFGGIAKNIKANDGRVYTQDNGTQFLCHLNDDVPISEGVLAGASFEQRTYPQEEDGFYCEQYEAVPTFQQVSRLDLFEFEYGSDSEVINRTYTVTDCNANTGDVDEVETISSTLYHMRGTYSDRGALNTSAPNRSYLVLSAEDREAVLFVHRQIDIAREGRLVKVSGGSEDLSDDSIEVHTFTGSSSSGTPSPPTYTAYEKTNATGETHDERYFPDGVTYALTIDSTVNDISGKCAVLLGSQVYEHDLTFGAAPNFYITNVSLEKFQPDLTAGHVTIENVTIRAMRGNMLKPEASMTPSDQTKNSVRAIDGAYTYVGGFPAFTPDEIKAFIGRS